MDEFEPKRSPSCPPCIATVSQKPFRLGDLQRQLPCAQASVAPPCLCTL